MRRLLFFSVLVAGLVATDRASAQFFPGSAGYDPFNAYYGFYLPRQAAMAVQRSYGPQSTIAALSAERQMSALTNGASLYDPSDMYDITGYDPTNPFPNRQAGRRPGGMARIAPANTGTGPSMYYNRSGSYFPGLKQGRGVNPGIRTSNARAGRYGGLGNYSNRGALHGVGQVQQPGFR